MLKRLWNICGPAQAKHTVFGWWPSKAAERQEMLKKERERDSTGPEVEPDISHNRSSSACASPGLYCCYCCHLMSFVNASFTFWRRFNNSSWTIKSPPQQSEKKSANRGLMETISKKKEKFFLRQLQALCSSAGGVSANIARGPAF